MDACFVEVNSLEEFKAIITLRGQTISAFKDSSPSTQIVIVIAEGVIRMP